MRNELFHRVDLLSRSGFESVGVVESEPSIAVERDFALDVIDPAKDCRLDSRFDLRSIALADGTRAIRAFANLS